MAPPATFKQLQAQAESLFDVAAPLASELRETITLLRLLAEGKPCSRPYPHYMVAVHDLSGTNGAIEYITKADGRGGHDPFQNDSYPYVLEQIHIVNIDNPASASNQPGIRIVEVQTEYELFGASKRRGTDATRRDEFIPYGFFTDENRLPRPLGVLPRPGYVVPPDGRLQVQLKSGDSADGIVVAARGYWQLPTPVELYDGPLDTILQLASELQRLLFHVARGRHGARAVPANLYEALSVPATAGRLVHGTADNFTNKGKYPFVLTDVVIPAAGVTDAKLRVVDRQQPGPRAGQVLGGDAGLPVATLVGTVLPLNSGFGHIPGGGYEIAPNGGFDVTLESDGSADTVQVDLQGYWKVPVGEALP